MSRPPIASLSLTTRLVVWSSSLPLPGPHKASSSHRRRRQPLVWTPKPLPHDPTDWTQHRAPSPHRRLRPPAVCYSFRQVTAWRRTDDWRWSTSTPSRSSSAILPHTNPYIIYFLIHAIRFFSLRHSSTYGHGLRNSSATVGLYSGPSLSSPAMPGSDSRSSSGTQRSRTQTDDVVTHGSMTQWRSVKLHFRVLAMSPSPAPDS